MEKQLSKTQQDKLDELRRQLAEGELTRAEVADLLETEIYAALGATDQPADNAWLDACSDMMAEMGRGAKRRVAGASAAELGGHPQGDSEGEASSALPVEAAWSPWRRASCWCF